MAIRLTSSGLEGMTYPNLVSNTTGGIDVTIGSMSVGAQGTAQTKGKAGKFTYVYAPSGGTYVVGGVIYSGGAAVGSANGTVTAIATAFRIS